MAPMKKCLFLSLPNLPKIGSRITTPGSHPGSNLLPFSISKYGTKIYLFYILQTIAKMRKIHFDRLSQYCNTLTLYYDSKKSNLK